MKNLIFRIKTKFTSDHWPVFVAGIVSSFINLFLPTILVRILPPEDIGIYKIFFLYIHSFTFLSLAGAPLYSVFYFVGKDNGRSYVDHAWKTSIVLSIIALIIGLILSPFIAAKINLTLNQTLLILITGAFITPSSFYGEYLLAKGKTVAGPLFHSSFEVFKGIGIILCAYYTRDINTTFYFFGFSFLLKFLLSFTLGIKEKILTSDLDKTKFKEIITYCAPMSSAGVLGFFLDKVDMLTLSSYLEPRDFAYYSMGCLMVPPLLILEMSVSKVLMPKLSRLWHEAKLGEMALSFKKAQEDISYLMIPAVFGLYIFSKPIIEILFTADYLESVPYLRVFAFSYLAYIIPHDTFARASGKTKWILKVNLVITPISLITVAYSAKAYGPLYALILTVIYRFIPKIWGLIYTAKNTHTKVRNLIPFAAFSKNLAINAILAIIVMNFKNHFDSDVKWFLICGPIYAAGFFLFHLFIKEVKKRKLIS